MNIIYAKEKINKKGKTIFLAGPSPRKNTDISWRSEAIKIFKDKNFQGTLLIPEERNEIRSDFNYIDQIEWEEEGLTESDIILFWIPRDLKTFPGFTTNIEFGYWMAKNPSKIILGSPQGTPKMDYINYYANKLNINNYNNLEEVIKNTFSKK